MVHLQKTHIKYFKRARLESEDPAFRHAINGCTA